MTQPLPDPIPSMMDASEQARLQERLKRTEQQLDHVMASTDNVVVSADSQGRIISWNPSAEKLLGFGAPEIIGHPFVELVMASHRHGAYFAVTRALGQGSPCAENWAMLGKGGQIVFLAWKCIPHYSEAGQVAGLVFIGKDLSIPDAEWMRQPQADATLGSVHQVLIHELRNQLTICASYTQLLLGGNEEEQDRRDCLERIYASIERASATIDNLVGLTRG